MDKNKLIKIIFGIRIILWITALIPTVYWIWYSIDLHNHGIFDPAEFGKYFRPVFYECLIIAVIAVCAAFALHAFSVKLKKQGREELKVDKETLAR